MRTSVLVRLLTPVTAFSLLASAVLITASPSLAEECGPSGSQGISGCTGSGRAEVGGIQSSPGQAPSKGSTTSAEPTTLSVACGPGAAARLEAVSPTTGANLATLCADTLTGCEKNPDPQLTGASITIVKAADGQWNPTAAGCTRPTGPQVTAALVRQRAVRLIPAASVGVAPHGATLINIETVLWVDAGHHDTLPTVHILGRTVRITLTLHHVHWDFGDGHTDTTTSPEPPYTDTDPCTTPQCPDYYGHTYRHPGTHTITATATWTARFTIDNGDPQPIPGTVTGPTAHHRIHVRQAHSVLVPNPGH